MTNITYVKRPKKKAEVKRVSYKVRLKDMQELKDSIIPIHKPMLFDYKTKVEAHLGSRKSGKTWSIIQRLIFYAMLFPDLKVLIILKVQTDIKDAIFATIKEHIEKSKYSKYFTIMDKEIRFNHGRGKFSYKGMDKPTNVKGFDQYNIYWYEEAENSTELDFTTLRSTLRAKPLVSPHNDKGNIVLYPKLIMSFNPAKVYHHWTKKLFHSTYTSAGHWVGEGLDSSILEEVKKNFKAKTSHSTALDNPFLSKEDVEELSMLEKYDPNAYKRDYLGLYAQATELLILRENLHYFIVKEQEFNDLWEGWTNDDNSELANSTTSKERKEELLVKRSQNQRVWHFGGADHSQGVGADPMTVVEMKVVQRKGKRPLLLIKPRLYDNTLALDTQIFAALDSTGMSKNIPYFGDCAQSGRNKSIRSHGYIFKDSYKTKLETRPTSRKRFKTVICSKNDYIHNRLVEEFRQWSFKQDKITKDIIEIPADGNDHFQNAIDYGIDSMERKGKVFSKI